ncbi:siroheme synthase CysG [uncultured Nitratireductor sp.]|uniref:siroheme synthase CysG n=1 Tax=uncultured Nitratireductor sp. TaxID=520953 RepID=UPI0025FCBED8|nr:siroheme synthase CysG [uncultured Nitratireductor sp.]
MNIASRQPNEASPARIAPLAVLPVFFDLSGKRAIVVGGTAAAAWKAELLAANGAVVHVHAKTLCDTFEELVRGGASAGSFVLHRRFWDEGDLREAAIAVCDAQDDTEAARFFAAAELVGVPVNVIDRPRFCQFQFGAVINRSPVVVGVSTAGAAPVLGQAIRRRIETLLPPFLAGWAEIAADLRASVMLKLAPGAPRRHFWETFVDRAFAAAPSDPNVQELKDDIQRGVTAERTLAGTVTLVGAGPGDADLLTLKAVRALQAADVILFDDLVSEHVLERARREAKRIRVGKRGGRRSCRQEDINALMLKLARDGKRVVRLKSGDPMIFGRAGEEIAMLQAHGVMLDVVPGVTAASALAAALGTSLTHRDHAGAVHFVTGRSCRGGLPDDLDWRALTDPAATTVFYMGGQTAREIAGRLIDLGLMPETPVAAGFSIGCPQQRLKRSDLAGLASGELNCTGGQPVLIGIGRVFEKQAFVGMERAA